MKTKRNYYSPEIDVIELDNTISLVLMSPESDPGEPTSSLKSDFFVNDPFKNQV